MLMTYEPKRCLPKETWRRIWCENYRWGWSLLQGQLYGELLASLRCLPHGYERKRVTNPEANQLKKCIAKMRESERHDSFAKKLQFQEALTPTDYSRPIDCDPDFDTPSCSTLDSPSPVSRTTRSTPSSKSSGQSNPQVDRSMFPKVKVRRSRNTINEQIMRCTVPCRL